MPVIVATVNAPKSLSELKSLLKDDNKVKVAGSCYSLYAPTMNWTDSYLVFRRY